MTAIPSQLPGYRLFTGDLMNSIITPVNNLTGNGTPGALTANGTTLAGTFSYTPQIISAAGQTQGSATAITSGKAVVTAVATATHNGVRLPTAATGLEVMVVSGVASGGFKVYPATGGKIAGASTNAADSTNLAALKANRYIAINTTLWAVLRGA